MDAGFEFWYEGKKAKTLKCGKYCDCSKDEEEEDEDIQPFGRYYDEDDDDCSKNKFKDEEQQKCTGTLKNQRKTMKRLSKA